MKEVKKCSISGVAFTMDADAYEALETYLESLKTTYKDTADGAEIVADIEARIAELILSAQDNTPHRGETADPEHHPADGLGRGHLPGERRPRPALRHAAHCLLYTSPSPRDA